LPSFGEKFFWPPWLGINIQWLFEDDLQLGFLTW